MDLQERAFEIAFAQLGDVEAMLPFVLVNRSDGSFECMTVVTAHSGKAQYLGRRLVRERAPSLDSYAIVTDAYVRQDGNRRDAIFVERGTRADPDARIVAQTYERVAAGPARRIGPPIDLGSRPSELQPWDPSALNWGAITPDMYLEARKLAVHVVNGALESEDNIRRMVRFLRARIRRYASHLPEGVGQVVHVDDRNQRLSAAARSLLRELGNVAQVAFATDRVK